MFTFFNKAEDANLIVISFRGTEPFNADDWSTNFDISWYDISQTSGSRHLHVGFLEALGLGSRIERNFKDAIRRTKGNSINNNSDDQMLMKECECDQSFDHDLVIKWSAYYRVKKKKKKAVEFTREAPEHKICSHRAQPRRRAGDYVSNYTDAE